MSHPTFSRLPVALVLAAGIVFHLGPACDDGRPGLSLATPAMAAGTGAAASPEGPVKTRRTYHTPQRLEAEREGYASAVPAADRYLERHTLEENWNWMTGQELPRAMGVHADGSSHRPDEADPWRVKVEIDGDPYRMPTNDFWTYHDSGLDERGFFDPEKADRSLLVNELYPEKGDDWGVDDGFGWEHENGTYWTFVAYYNHWYGLIEVRRRITTFRDAYLYTGDPKYARAGLILLDRVADIYPEMDTSAHIDPAIPRNRRPFRNSNGGTDQGRLVGSIWETNHIRHIVAAYDAFFPLIREGDDELIEFLNRKAEKYPGLEGKESTEALATGAPLIEARTARLEGRVIDFTREMRKENHLHVEAAGITRHAGELPGRWIYVENDNWRNGAYEIVAVEPEGGDRAKLHLGNTTLIRRFRDPENFDAGYVYNLDEGAAFYIPLSKSRSRAR